MEKEKGVRRRGVEKGKRKKKKKEKVEENIGP